jgi:hypothetical protein
MHGVIGRRKEWRFARDLFRKPLSPVLGGEGLG